MHRELDDDGGKEARKHVPKFADHLGGCLCGNEAGINRAKWCQRDGECVEKSANKLRCREMESLNNGPVV